MEPLEDVRIIAIEQYGAGSWGSVLEELLSYTPERITELRAAGAFGSQGSSKELPDGL